MLREEHSHSLDQLLEMFLREWKEHKKTLEENNQISGIMEVIEERRVLKPALTQTHRVSRRHRNMQSISETYRAFVAIHLIANNQVCILNILAERLM